MKTPKGMRLHIGLYGRRNVGKSSLLNALTHQQISIVSSEAGTTTDPVDKAMEFHPLGPVLFIDTAGLDDEGTLGQLRIQKTEATFERVELALLVTDGPFGDFEESLLSNLTERKIPVIAVFNKSENSQADRTAAIESLTARKIKVVQTDAVSGKGLDDLRQALLAMAPEDHLLTKEIAADLIPPGGLAMLVMPIDKEAPKGRLIMPQVQTLRDLLDHGIRSLVVQPETIERALEDLKTPPDLVVTDSQAFGQVSKVVPESIPLTGFSVLFARFKGDAVAFAEGACTLGTLKPGDPILIAEACSHHAIEDDIGRIKIPRWLSQIAGGDLDVTVHQGMDFPSDLSRYKVVIHCGACVFNRRAVLSRILQCRAAGVPITNYGMAIAWTHGLFERALAPFPEALEACKGLPLSPSQAK